MSPIASITALYRLLESAIPSRGLNDAGALATASADGIGCVRTVLLRGFDPAAHQLWINSNIRTEKVKHLRHNPDAEVCLWLPRKKIQLRLRAEWRVIDTVQAGRLPALADLRQRAWVEQPPFSKRLFTDDPTDDPPAEFAVLLGTLYQIDALRLSRNTYEQFLHRRPRATWESQRVT